jgi:hypothetical protein
MRFAVEASDDGAADVTGFFQTLTESRHQMGVRGERPPAEESECRYFRLLRVRPERPRNRRAESFPRKKFGTCDSDDDGSSLSQRSDWRTTPKEPFLGRGLASSGREL